MPIPIVMLVFAAAAGAAGVGAATHSAVKIKKANDKVKTVNKDLEQSKALFQENNTQTIRLMDSIGNEELKILNSFKQFADLIEKIHNRPKFIEYDVESVSIPQYNQEELKRVSVGAGVLLGGLSGAALGTAGGFAAAGATTSAVMALGTASTGTAIASLNGVAATNATLAALGGGAVAAGGGGMALGVTVLGMTTLGVGLLVGGAVFEVVGAKLSSKADTERLKLQDSKLELDKINEYLRCLENTANKFKKTLSLMHRKYHAHLMKLKKLIVSEGKRDWNEYTSAEKLLIENTILLVGLLYKMCQVKLVLKADDEKSLNTVNTSEVTAIIQEVGQILEEKFNIQV